MRGLLYSWRTTLIERVRGVFLTLPVTSRCHIPLGIITGDVCRGHNVIFCWITFLGTEVLVLAFGLLTIATPLVFLLSIDWCTHGKNYYRNYRHDNSHISPI